MAPPCTGLKGFSALNRMDCLLGLRSNGIHVWLGHTATCVPLAWKTRRPTHISRKHQRSGRQMNDCCEM
eukprot:7524812-Prorocentrum_lima.AAC.1